MNMEQYWSQGVLVRKAVICVRAITCFYGDVLVHTVYDDQQLDDVLCKWLYWRRLDLGQKKITPVKWEEHHSKKPEVFQITWANLLKWCGAADKDLSSFYQDILSISMQYDPSITAEEISNAERPDCWDQPRNWVLYSLQQIQAHCANRI